MRDNNFTEDLGAMVLYILMTENGWGKKKLHRFWKTFVKKHRTLIRCYKIGEPGDIAWLAHRKLKEIGVDIHQWYKEEDYVI